MIEPGPVGCEWADVLDIRTSTYKDANGVWVSRCASVRLIPGTTYVLVDPTTGEICDLPHRNYPDEKGQYNLF